jgi:hypothetical protein
MFLLLLCTNVFSYADEKVPSQKKEQVLDFSAGVIEGELNRPSILMELGNNFKDFNDLILLLREDFNSYHQVDSVHRFRFIEE